jgi:pimeloyl-ACP methyl ester carboxylesterase
MPTPSSVPPPSNPDRSATVVRAAVFDGITDTPYHRAGRGAPVIVLAPDDSRVGDALLAALSLQFRVIAPDLPCRRTNAPGAHPSFPTWFRGFLDGLGLSRVALVAESRFGAAALAFALLEPERVQRLAVVFNAAEEPAPHEAIADSLRRAGTPVLVCWPAARDVDEWASEIARFLSAPPAAGD